MLLWLPLCAAEPDLRLTIVYDNTAARPDLQADWGFSTLVDFRGQRVLFDAGTQPRIFLNNLDKLGIPKNSIQKTIISHEEPQHSRMVRRLVPAGLLLFFDSFSSGTPQADALGLPVVRGRGPAVIGPGIYSTGELPGSPPEQALVIATSKGLVMIVSCAHPGIVKMVETAEKQRGVGRIRLLAGGLHMYEQSEPQIRAAAAQLQKLNVQSVMLGHCTGDAALRIFQQAYGARFETAGAGKKIDLD